MNAISIHPFRAWTLAVFLVSSVGQSVLAQVNDDFADRIVLDGILPVSETGSNVGATTESDEPDFYEEDSYGSSRNSVWWEWTAPFSGTVQIDTFGSDFDTELAVYTGMDLGTLSKITGNDQAGDGDQSRVRFAAVMGTTYQVAVDGFSGSEGDVALTISMTPPGPPNDNFEDRITLQRVLPISTGGSNVNASVELGEPAHVGNGSESSVWWEWTAAFSGPVQIDTFGSDFDTELAVYRDGYGSPALANLNDVASNEDSADRSQSCVLFLATVGTTYHIAVDGSSGSEGHIELTISMAPPERPNDDFEDRIVLPSVLPTSTSGSNLGATPELDEPARAGRSPGSSVWWEWTAPSSGTVQIDTFGSDADTDLAVFTGMDLAMLREVASNVGDQSLVLFSAVMGTTYQISVDSRDSYYEGNIALTIGLAPPGPPNDNFADRIALPSGLPTSTGGSNVNASIELDEPVHAGSSGGNSVWWEWTAPSSGPVQIDTFGSDFDTVLAVYTGMDIATLNEVARNMDSADGDQSRVLFSAVMGTTYHIAVDGRYYFREGDIALTIGLAPPGPPNDNFADRIALPSVLPTSTGGSNVNATVELDEPAHAGNFPERSVWWEWTAPSSGLVQIDTFGSDVPTDLAVYTGMTLATLCEVTSNDLVDSGRSRVRFSAAMGTTYQIAIDGDEDAPGKLSLNIGMGSSPSVIQ